MFTSLSLNNNNNNDNNNDENNEANKKGDFTDKQKEQQIKVWETEFKNLKFLEYLDKVLSLDENEKIPELNEEIDVDEFMEFISLKIEELGLKIEEHEHKLIYCLTNFDWECNKCKKNYNKSEPKFYCSVCDFSYCDKCRENDGHLLQKPFPENTECPNLAIKDKFIKSENHKHRLVYCRTSRSIVFSGWVCSKCQKFFEKNEWSFYCTLCDYDFCNDCIKSNEKDDKKKNKDIIFSDKILIIRLLDFVFIYYFIIFQFIKIKKV